MPALLSVKSSKFNGRRCCLFLHGDFAVRFLACIDTGSVATANGLAGSGSGHLNDWSVRKTGSAIPGGVSFSLASSAARSDWAGFRGVAWLLAIGASVLVVAAILRRMVPDNTAQPAWLLLIERHPGAYKQSVEE
jgi:hypothetical protein